MSYSCASRANKTSLLARKTNNDTQKTDRQNGLSFPMAQKEVGFENDAEHQAAAYKKVSKSET